MMKSLVKGRWSLVFVGAGAAYLLAACGGGSKGGGGDAPADNPNPDTGVVDTNVRLAGSLNLLGNSSAAGAELALAGDTFDIYCVTFEDTPVACKAEIVSGAFDKTCEKYAGKAFGCFLRQDGKTVGDIVFDQGDDSDSQLVAGAGTIQFALNFDPELGVATAVVDTSASSALADEAVAAAQSAVGSSTTSLPSLTGTYKLEVLGFRDDEGNVVAPPSDDQGGEGGEGGKGGGAPESIYLNEFDVGGVRKVSIWESKAAFDQCKINNGGTELKPSFGAQVGNAARVAIDPSNLGNYQTSMGKIIGQFANAHPEAFGQLLDATGSQWEARRCAEQEKNLQNASQTISATNCRLLAPGFREVKYWNPETNKEEIRQEPEWFQTWTEISSLTSIDGSKIVTRQQECFNPLVGTASDSFMPPCPPDWSEANKTTPTGKFTTYEFDSGSGTRPVQFLCRNGQDQSGGLMHFPVVKPTTGNDYLTASINAAKTNTSPSDPGCDKVKVADLFAGGGLSSSTGVGARETYKSSRRVVLQTFSELLRSASEGRGDEECSYYEKPSSQTLASWDFDTNCGNNGPSSPVCWDYEWNLKSIGVKLNTARNDFVIDTTWQKTNQQPHFQDGLHKLCPGSLDPEDSRPGSGEDWEDFTERLQDAKEACRTEFLGLANKTARMSALFDATLDPSRRPPSVILLCSEDDAVQTAVTSLASSSCLPDVSLDFRCEGGNNCTEVLRCSGTEDGKCADADGNYLGRVPGRFEQTTLKAGTNNAFAMSSLTIETWSQWGSDGEKVCKAARSFKLEGLKTADEPLSFNAFLTFGDNQKCEGDTEEGGEGEGGGRRDEVMNIKFTKQ